MQGTSHADFEPVAETFHKQLGRTDGGAAVAVYHRGELVVDLWGGRRTDEGRLWEADTLAMCFSTTKGVASLALHLQADAGKIDYDAPVAEYWPEFAQNGKEDITVRHVLSHSAGLHRLRSVIDLAHHMLDWDHMVEALAEERPAYEPGTKSGYHALTYGWLVGEIVRRVTGQDLAHVVTDQIAKPLNLDGLYLGCPESERDRVAPLAPFGNPRAKLPSPLHRAEKMIGQQMGKTLSFIRSPVNPRRIINALVPRGMEDIMAGPEIMDASVPAMNGFFTARSLAAMYAVYAGDGEFEGTRLLSPATVEAVGTTQNNRRDLVLVFPMQWKLGYHRVMTSRGPLPTGFGHFGFGGSGAWADPTRELSVAMVCNRGSGTPVGDMRLMQLGTAAIAAVDGRDGVDPSRSDKADAA